MSGLTSLSVEGRSARRKAQAMNIEGKSDHGPNVVKLSKPPVIGRSKDIESMYRFFELYGERFEKAKAEREQRSN